LLFFFLLPTKVYGDFTLLSESDKTIFAYTRQLNDAKMLVVLNFSAQDVVYDVPIEAGVKADSLKVILDSAGDSTDLQMDVDGKWRVGLKAFGGRVYLL